MTGRSRLGIFAAALLAAIAIARVAATYSVYSNTFDEPDHISAGLEWIERGTYTFEPMHPPLARIAMAAGPYLDGVRIHDVALHGTAANRVLYDQGKYTRDLTFARIGILPFFVAAIAGVFFWARRLAGTPVALLAVALFTTTPLVLAHAGVATNDMALTGVLTWALFSLTLWLDDPRLRNAVAVGIIAALALTAKLSAVLFLPLSAAVFVASRWVISRRFAPSPGAATPRTPNVWLILKSAAVAGAAMMLVTWAVYRFSIGSRLGSVIPGGVPVPFPEFFYGIQALIEKNSRGHSGFLLGEYRTTGWWYFFPFGIAVKTPIALLVLTFIGAAVAVRTAWARKDWRYVAPIAAAVAMLAASMTSKINIGMRHVLPMFPLLAITAALGVAWLWSLTLHRTMARVAVVVLLAWQIGVGIRAHPDYLPYFNEFAGSHPEHLLRDSDLDWGQDLLRLADTVRAKGIDTLQLAYWGRADATKLVPAVTLPFTPAMHPTGWVAISEQMLSHADPQFAGYGWLQHVTPVARIGKSIKLYHIGTRPMATAR
jgi:hypothetical protein